MTSAPRPQSGKKILDPMFLFDLVFPDLRLVFEH
jgi:hypothetical protein